MEIVKKYGRNLVNKNKIVCKFFDFLISLVKRNEKNNFYISEKNVNEKFIEELKKYGKKRATE